MLGHRLVIEKTIVLVDASSGGDQIVQEPLARAQVEAADAVVVTKPGTCNLNQRSAVAATLRELVPEAAVTWAERGVDVVADIDTRVKPRRPGVSSKEPIRAYRLDARDAPWVAMSAWLSAVIVARGDDIMRVKGVMRTPAGRLLLQSVRKHVQPAEIMPEPVLRPGEQAHDEDFIVLIGRSMDEERLVQSWRRFVATP